jgi:hypothetical protein
VALVLVERNPKVEIRNPKQIRNPNDEGQKRVAAEQQGKISPNWNVAL